MSQSTVLNLKTISLKLKHLSNHHFLYKLMLCPYCENIEASLANSYSIDRVAQRFIPTYYHSQIFGEAENLPTRIRCTPTYHSRLFKNDDYSKKCNHAQQITKKTSNKNVTYKNISRERKQDEFYNSHGNCNYNSKNLWFDSDKETRFKQLGCCMTGYSQQRKGVDLSSNPVFGGQFVKSCNCGRLNIEEERLDQLTKKALQKEKKLSVQQDKFLKYTDNEVQTDKTQEQCQRVKPVADIPIESKPCFNKEIKQKTKKSKVSTNYQKIIPGNPTFTVVRKRQF